MSGGCTYRLMCMSVLRCHPQTGNAASCVWKKSDRTHLARRADCGTCEALPWSASCWRVMAMELGVPGEQGSYIGCPFAGLISLQHRILVVRTLDSQQAICCTQAFMRNEHIWTAASMIHVPEGNYSHQHQWQMWPPEVCGFLRLSDGLHQHILHNNIDVRAREALCAAAKLLEFLQQR
jgi:hypothetical protein